MGHEASRGAMQGAHVANYGSSNSFGLSEPALPSPGARDANSRGHRTTSVPTQAKGLMRGPHRTITQGNARSTLLRDLESRLRSTHRGHHGSQGRSASLKSDTHNARRGGPCPR